MDAPKPPSRPWQVADALWALLFAYAVFVNLNDPDPLIWGALYGAGSATAALAAFGRVRTRHAGLLALLYTIAALMIASQGIEESHPMKGFPQYGVFREEIVRESLGLGLVAVWMGVIAARQWWAERADR